MFVSPKTNANYAVKSHCPTVHIVLVVTIENCNKTALRCVFSDTNKHQNLTRLTNWLHKHQNLTRHPRTNKHQNLHNLGSRIDPSYGFSYHWIPPLSTLSLKSIDSMIRLWDGCNSANLSQGLQAYRQIDIISFPTETSSSVCCRATLVHLHLTFVYRSFLFS